MLIVGELKARQVGSSDAFGGVDPKGERVAAKIGGAIVVAHHADFGVPAAAFDRAPLQAECVRRREEGVCVDRETAVGRVEGTWGDRTSASVEVVVRGLAVGEDQVVQVVVLRQCARPAREQRQQDEATKRLKHTNILNGRI